MRKPWTWKNVEIPAEIAAKLRQEFEVGFFQQALEHDPDNVDILVYLGDVFSKRGQTHAGLEIDKRLVRLCPEEPTFHYNLACSYSLLNDLEMALKSIARAIQLGYQNFDHMQQDADLENLRKDIRFINLMKELSPQS